MGRSGIGAYVYRIEAAANGLRDECETLLAENARLRKKLYQAQKHNESLVETISNYWQGEIGHNIRYANLERRVNNLRNRLERRGLKTLVVDDEIQIVNQEPEA